MPSAYEGQGFNCIGFIRAADNYQRYQKLGIKRLNVYINEFIEFECDEPGTIDC